MTRGAAARRQWRLVRSAAGLQFRAAPVTSLVSVVVMAASGTAPVLLAWFTGRLVDGLGAGDAGQVRIAVVGFGVLAALTPCLGYLSRYVEQETSRRVTLRTQAALFTAVAARPGLAELEDSRFHDRLRLAQEASRYAPTQLTSSLLGIGSALLTVGGFTGVLLQWSPAVAGLVLLAGVPTLVAQVRLARLRGAMLERTAPMFRRQLFYAALLLDMRAAKEIRLFGLGAFFRDRMVRELRSAQEQERTQDRLALRVDTALALMAGVISLVALASFAGRVADGRAGVGDLVVVIAALAALQVTLSMLVQEVAGLGEVLHMFGHYADITAPPTAAVPGGVPPRLSGAVELDDVWFRYAPDHDWVLRGVTLTIPRGTSLALVGDNGAGKSTIVKLLCGLYEPTRGAVRWDGADLRSLDPTGLRARIGVTFQDFMSYELSALDNVAVGDLSAHGDRSRIRAAAAAAGIDAAISCLPRGYDTMLTRAFGGSGPGSPASGDEQHTGVVLSGGQWQRVALARAVLRSDADLFILDEPSSGLDVESEHQLHRRLTAMRGDRTSLLISHRLNTVRGADRIVVLRDGRVAEQGTHADLMALDGRYAHLFRLQAAGFLDEPEPEVSR